jgi:hypothetical protein
MYDTVPITMVRMSAVRRGCPSGVFFRIGQRQFDAVRVAKVDST